ncbi:MAG TPA: tRNA uridine-5-carboxymethylaminomethyl(34) synthesis GTPase MnmE, partial [Luteimonas sp.]|nr:tRNA uridine-5-carboxymethylaminomethyl(34) synthesis GTPase MnmE [Luteimonas sp.]
DTAGLREGGDAIEREGMRRARDELRRADLALVVLDARDPEAGLAAVAADLADVPRRIVVHNKIDLLPAPPASAADAIMVSARTGAGLERVHARLREAAAGGDPGEGAFTARARHVDALRRSAQALAEAEASLHHEQLELAAEALRLGHDALGEITGRTLPDDLLGAIFSSFCIGK